MSEIQSNITDIQYKTDIIKHYQNKINIILKNTDVMTQVRLTHKNVNICFNCSQREILYSIQNCFKFAGYNNSTFQENIFGKALLIPIENVKKNVYFKDFMKHYNYYFMKRLILIEIYFNHHKIKFNDCLREKNMLLNKYSIIHKLPQFPIEINRYIQEFLIIDIKQYLIVRRMYEKYRQLV